MSVVKLIDDYLLQFGNERFVEGWNGQQERVANLLEVMSLTPSEIVDIIQSAFIFLLALNIYWIIKKESK